MKNATLFLFIFSAFGLFAQDFQYETLKCLFYDLEIDSTDNFLVNQIENHPSVRFRSTDKVDTLHFNGLFAFVNRTPKIFGMPEYRVFDRSADRLGADSTFLFLGDGAGVQTSSEQLDDTKYYTIETVEVTRYFSEEQGVVFAKICEELAGLFPDSPAFEWNSDNTSRYTISLEDNGKYLHEKQLVLEYVELTDRQMPTYVISLSYEKYIPTAVI